MFQLILLAFCKCDRDNIKAYSRGGVPALFQEHFGCALQVLALLVMHAFFGPAVQVVDSCFYFDKYEVIALAGDDVYFLSAPFPVGVQDMVALLLYVYLGDLFPFFAQLIMGSHFFN